MQLAEAQLAIRQAAELEALKAVERAQVAHRAAQLASDQARQDLLAAQEALAQLFEGVEELARLDELAAVDLTVSTEEEDAGFPDDLWEAEQ